MKYQNWKIINEEFDSVKKRSRDALFTIGNGYFGIRGFFEEDKEGVDGSGGIYMAGIFGKGDCESWEGASRELCVSSNMLRANIWADKEAVSLSGAACNFRQELNMQTGIYTRTYTYKTTAGKKLNILFERFAHRRKIHCIGQKISIMSLDSELELELEALIDSDVKNLNLVSSEPLPVQPGRSHIKDRRTKTNYIMTVLDDEEETGIHFAQQSCAFIENSGKRHGIKGKTFITEKQAGESYKILLKKGQKLVVEKIAAAYTTRDGADCEEKIAAFTNVQLDYETEKKGHINAWADKWDIADIEIESDGNDQAVVRYNIFQLLCVCPEHTDRLSIGARGLSGEMYEGCVFWDNEIFKLPFFIYTNPAAARNLLMFRYHTLDAAKRHAAKNWFEGAMYPWQASEKGIEQTPYNVGAFYAIHIAADIAYAVRQYWEVTGDDDFMLKYGAEIMIETARFFVSRCEYREAEGIYEICAVRGPNEYDVYVNNNVYTNMMAAQNFAAIRRILTYLEKNYPKECQILLKQLHVTLAERKLFSEIEKNLKIPYCQELDLYEEDDRYLKRRPLDMKKAKPGGKRIIDSTLPYEALPLYQITKQADVILLMNLLPHLFTDNQKKQAYLYYEPRTAHDSSLSYAPHAILAARAGLMEESYDYFVRSAYLDIDDRQLNTISGLHFANFGGTWQAVILGYGGVSQAEGELSIKPKLPKEWNSMRFKIIFRGKVLTVQISRENGREYVEIQ